MIPRMLKIPKINSFFLFGPRQVGKTSLIRQAFLEERQLHYDLLASDQYFRLKARPGLLGEEIQAARDQVSLVIIDEIQKIPELLDEIHRLMESPNPPVFVMTGSSARKLKRSSANMLGGRAWNLKLFPLTHHELGDQFDLDRALSRGTLPKIYLAEHEEAHQLLRSYIETYLKEEIEVEAIIRSLGPFLRFLPLAAQESGQILNYATMSRDTGTSAKTIKEYYSILEDTLLGSILPAFQKSHRKRLATHPKFYFFDTGVVRALCKLLTVPLEAQTYEYGRAFEHFVLNEIIRLNTYYQRDFSLSYYRTEHGAEVDLIIERPGAATLAVEIKSSVNPSVSDIRGGLASFQTLVPTARLICVCKAANKRLVEGFEILPWRDFFKEIFLSSTV